MMKDMSCKSVLEMLDAYLDGELSQEDTLQVEKHLQECASCRQELDWRRNILEICSELDDGVQEPPECRAAWQSAVRNASKATQVKKWNVRRISRWTAGVAACLALIVGATSVLNRLGLDRAEYAGERNYKAAAYPEDALYESAEYELDGGAMSPMYAGFALSSDSSVGEDDITTGSYAQPRTQKVIRSANRTIESTDYDADAAKLNDLVDEYGAYFEERSESGRAVAENGNGRSLSCLIRVPTASLDNFLKSLVAVGTMIQSSESAADVSDQYYDTETRLTSLRAQLARLQEMVATAETTDDLLSIDDRIQAVEYEIESLEGSLQSMNSRISYSSVRVTLSEVREEEATVVVEPTLGERISKGFHDSVKWMKDFFQNVAVALAVAAPQLAIWIPALLLAYLAYRLIRRAIKRRK